MFKDTLQTIPATEIHYQNISLLVMLRICP